MSHKDLMLEITGNTQLLLDEALIQIEMDKVVKILLGKNF